MPRWIRILGGIGSCLLIVLALYQSSTAAIEAKAAAHDNKKTVVILQWQAKVLERQAWDSQSNNHERAVNACGSSTKLRSLLNDLDAILISPTSTDPKSVGANVRIHEYTDENSNCTHIPPAPTGTRPPDPGPRPVV